MTTSSKEAATTVKKPGTPAALNRYFIISNPDGGWWIVKEGNKKRLQRVRDKATAIETSKLIARHHPPSEVHVEKRDGSIEMCFSYNGPVID
jgi:hypothetical protein